MKKSIFWICLVTLALLCIGCPDKNKIKPPTIEEIDTLENIASQFDPNQTETTPENPPIDSSGNTSGSGTKVDPPPKPPTPPTPQTPPDRGDYTVQFMALKDRTRVEEVRRILTASAYFAEIHEVEINGETMYRLRLAGSYSQAYAKQLAEKIKKEIAEIDDYWVTRK